MNDELEEGEVAIDSLETDVQDELKTHKEKKKVKKSKNKPTPNKVESPEDPFPSNPGPYERIEKKIKVEGKQYPRKNKNEFTTSTYKTKPCEFFRKGSCQKGNDCTFSHDIQVGQPDVVCKFYVTGNCQKGDSCPFSHDLKKYPCKYFWGAGNCSQGINCKFSHEPLHDKQKAMDFIEENEQHFMNMYSSMGKTNLGNLFLEYLQRKADQNKDTRAQHLLLPPTQDQNPSHFPPPPQQQNQFSIPPQSNYPQQNMPPANLQPRQFQNPNPNQNPYDRPPQNQQQQMFPGPGQNMGPGPGPGNQQQQYHDPSMMQQQKSNFMPPPPNQNFQNIPNIQNIPNKQFQPPNQYMPQSSQPPHHMQQQQQNYQPQPQPNRQYPPQNQFGPAVPGPQNQMQMNNPPQNLGYPQNPNIHGGPPQMNQPQMQMQHQHHHYQPQGQHHQYQQQQQQQQGQPHHYQPHPGQHQQHPQNPQHHHYQQQQQPQHHHFMPQQQGPQHNQYPERGDPRFQRQNYEENRMDRGGDPRFQRQTYEENRMGGGDPRFPRQNYEDPKMDRDRGGPHNVYNPPSRMENNPYQNPNNPPHYQKPIQQDNFQPQGPGPIMHQNQPQNEPWRRQPQMQGPPPQQVMNQFPNQPQLQPQPQIQPQPVSGMQQILPPAQNTAVFLGPPRDGPAVNTFTPGLSNQQQQQGLLMVPEEIKSDKSPTGNIYLPTNKDPRFESQQKRSEEKTGPGPLPNQYFSKDAKPPAEIKPTREKEVSPPKEIQQEKPTVVTEEPEKTQETTTESEQPAAKSSFWNVVKSRQMATKAGRKVTKSPPKEERERKPVLMQYSPEHIVKEKPKEKIKDPNEEKYFNKSKILEKLGLTQKIPGQKKAELNYDLDKLFSTFEFHNSEKGMPPAKIPKEVAISNIKDTINSLKDLLVSNE